MLMNLLHPTDLKQCQLTHLHSFTKGMTVYKQGETAKEFYYVNSGLIGLYHTLDNGKESLVRLYQKGDYFGYRTLFGDNATIATPKFWLKQRSFGLSPKTLILSS